MSWSQVTATTESWATGVTTQGSWAMEDTASGSWGTGVTTQGSWATTDVPLVPPPWAMLSSVTTSVDVGVDFTLRFEAQYPMYLSSDRPIALYDVYPEGTP